MQDYAMPQVPVFLDEPCSIDFDRIPASHCRSAISDVRLFEQMVCRVARIVEPII